MGLGVLRVEESQSNRGVDVRTRRNGDAPTLQADGDTRPDSLARLAAASHELGILTAEIGDVRDALTAHREALAILRKLAESHPAIAQYQSDLAASHKNLGFMLSAAGRPTEAWAAFEEALAIRRKLAEDHPTVTEYQRDLANSHKNLGFMLSAAGRPRRGRRTRRRGRSCASSLRITPQSPSTSATWRPATSTSATC